LQPGDDEIRAHRSQIMVRAEARFFDRAYGAPIGCLVIPFEPRNLLAKPLCDCAPVLVVQGSRLRHDHPRDARDLGGERNDDLVDMHARLELVQSAAKPIARAAQMEDTRSCSMDQEPAAVPVISLVDPEELGLASWGTKPARLSDPALS